MRMTAMKSPNGTTMWSRSTMRMSTTTMSPCTCPLVLERRRGTERTTVLSTW